MKEVDLYFDYASPYSYLANAMIPTHLAGIAVRYHPVYLRGFEMFLKGVPYTGAKISYLTQDLQRCAAHEEVPLAPPAQFPINGIHLLRGAYVARGRGAFERFHDAAFKAAWAEGRDVSDPRVALDVLAEVLGVASTEREALAAATTSPEIKNVVRTTTEAAVARGAFGAPAFFVGEELFWGHDRLDYVRRAAQA